MSGANVSMEEQTVRKVTKRILPYIFLLFIVANMDRVNLGYVALTMNKDLAISSEAFGLLAGIFFIGYVIFEVPSNILMHKFGARKWIARILITWGLVVVLMAGTQNATHLYILRFLLGLAEAGFFPGIILYITYWFRSKDQGRAYALFYIALPVSNIIGAPLSTWLMDTVHWFGWAGWRWTFVMEGLPAVVLGIITFFYLTDRPRQANWLTIQQKDWLEAELERERKLKGERPGHFILNALRNRQVWHLAVVYLMINVGLYGIGFWMPQIIKGFSTQMSSTQVGLVTMVPYIFAGIAMVLWARHSDKTGERLWHAALPPLIGAVGLSGCALVANPTISLVMLTVTTIGLFCFFAPFWPIPNRFLAGESAAVAIAVINSIGNFGGFFGPYLMGYTKQITGNLSSGLYFLSGALILCSVLLLTFGLQHRRPQTSLHPIPEQEP